MKRPYAFALVSLLLIPVVLVAGGVLFNMIDPEVAAGHPNYETNYRLLGLVKHLALLLTLALIGAVWLLACFFLLKSKKQSFLWLALAALGPFGLAILTMLGDKAPDPRDRYRAFLRQLKPHARVVLELCIFVAVWVIAYQAMVLKRNLMITLQAAASGVSEAKIIEQQAASSGMWAFGEGNEVLYLVALLYLLWPLLFNVASRLPPGIKSFPRRFLSRNQ